MWTALPRAADADSIELDVFVSPRLGLDATQDRYELSDFPDFEHWTKTLGEQLAFKVELDDGSRLDAAVVALADLDHEAGVQPPPTLDHDSWDHLFRATTFVRPWTFTDLSLLPIYSYSARFITAYLRDLYTDIGRNHPTLPPTAGALDGLRTTVAPVVDVRVHEERKPPPREEREFPIPEPPSTPAPEPPGCTAWLWGWLRALCALVRLLWRRLPARARQELSALWARLPARLRSQIAALLALVRALLEPKPGPPPDPTTPKVRGPRTIHPSPYGVKPPLGPARLAPLERLAQQMQAHKVIAPSVPRGAMKAALDARNTTFDFARAKAFFERTELGTPAASKPPPTLPELDFHQALGALADYPELLRRLGLVVRLKVVRPAGIDTQTIRVIALWQGQTRARDVSPRTHCTLEAERFTAAGKPGSELSEGMLDLRDASDLLTTDSPKFDLLQLDSDGAALKTILRAATLERAAQLKLETVGAPAAADRETIPGLRSGGLAIVRPDRAWHLHKHLLGVAAKALPKALPKAPVPAAAPSKPVEPVELPEDLYAEDLLRGYRVEVSTAGGAWLSLCSRVGTYELVDDAGKVVREVLSKHTDEGYVKRTSATSEGGTGHPLYVHEALTRWTGWSLTVPRVGRTLENRIDPPPPLVPGEDPPRYDTPELPRSEAVTEFRLVTRFSPKPRSLPRLRFGVSYRMRALGVDLAGEPLATPTDASPHSDAVSYRRFEPAGPPAALALRPFLPGESLERLVLRSDWNRGNPTYDDQEMKAAPADAQAQRTRHLFAPKTSQQMAELHGMLDVAFEDGAALRDPDAGYRISLRESGTFSPPDDKIIDVATVDLKNPQPTIPFGAPERVEPANDNDPGAYQINRADETLTTPYLPDPICAGIALRGLPGLVDAVSGDAVLPVHQVQAGDDPAVTEPLLQIPHAGVWPDLGSVRLRVAEQTAPGQPPHWDEKKRLLTVYLPKAARATVRYSSYLSQADLDQHGIWDWLAVDDPASPLRGQAESGAHWMITPPRTLELVHAVQRPLKRAGFSKLDAVRAIGQTTVQLSGVLQLHVASTGRIDVIGLWNELLDDPEKGVRREVRQSVACDFVVDRSWTTDMVFPPEQLADRASHEFGDTRHRRISYSVRATTSFREYLPETLEPDALFHDTLPKHWADVSVLNSARPIVPEVLYVVPTFEWPSVPPPAGWSSYVHERGGGGMRVYLDRPWFASGEGELLGVLLQGTQALPDELCSRYGIDPIWWAPPPLVALTLEPEHFLKPHVVEKDVSLAEDKPVKLKGTVVGFEPQWDSERKRWFCDINLDVDELPWSYWPFVRLAFVRYQPESLDDAKISRVVLGEFGQVAPQRALSIAWQADNQHVDVRLRGRAPTGPLPPLMAVRVQVTEVPAPQQPDELDWVHASGHDELVTGVDDFLRLKEPELYDDGSALWQALGVELPAKRGGLRMRLEVAEYELLGDEEDDPGAMLAATVSEFERPHDEEDDPGANVDTAVFASAQDVRPQVWTPRITYVAHVPLD